MTLIYLVDEMIRGRVSVAGCIQRTRAPTLEMAQDFVSGMRQVQGHNAQAERCFGFKSSTICN
ncbi:hypothetical protein UF78_09360 [Stutzerimonas stutzeri]|uniref:Uncharacterized protein n=1 Tax=Stutzerimonas stutzeri TaxID=316 RepID=A0A0D9ASI3_STUST|nr:hypothetical protein UF78_09360 [Stutzerimonas stutzeri]